MEKLIGNISERIMLIYKQLKYIILFGFILMNVITSSCVDTHSNVMICVITISKQFGSIIQKRVPVGIVL